MTETEEIGRLKRAVREGEVAACIPLADLLEESGHPHGADLQEMAVSIRDETDWVLVFAAMALFLELVEA